MCGSEVAETLHNAKGINWDIELPRANVMNLFREHLCPLPIRRLLFLYAPLCGTRVILFTLIVEKEVSRKLLVLVAGEISLDDEIALEAQTAQL